MPPTRPAAPPRRPVCALGQIRGSAAPVCFGDGVGAGVQVQHNARCPEARRLARWRAVEAGILTAVTILALGALGLAALVSVGTRTCGLGVAC